MTDDELFDNFRTMLKRDRKLRDAIEEAIERKNHHWLADLVVKATKLVLGEVVGSVVENAIDWIIKWFKKR